MADAQTPNASTPSPAKGGTGLLIMVALAAAALGGVGGMAVLLTHQGPAGAAAPGASAHGEAPAHGEHEESHGGESHGGEGHGGGGGGGDGALVTMAPFIVNLTDDAGEIHYLKTTLAVEVGASQDEKALEQRTPRARNAILLYLSSLRISETQGVANKNKMLERLAELLREICGRNAVRGVYFTEMVIQ